MKHEDTTMSLSCAGHHDRRFDESERDPDVSVSTRTSCTRRRRLCPPLRCFECPVSFPIRRVCDKSSTTDRTEETNSTSVPFDPSAPSNVVLRIRLLFVISLVIVAIALGISSYIMVYRSEHELGESQFQSIAARALNVAAELALRRRVVVKSIAQVAASAFPDASSWPNVAIPAFEVIAEDATRTTDNLEMAFYPMVQPEAVLPGQQSAFEEFAYNYFYNVREPPYPETTAVKSFGRGIWTRHADHDTTGNTDGLEYMEWKSPYQILFPELQNNRKGVLEIATLMMNVHGDRSRGRPIDDAIACSLLRYQQQRVDIDCGVITDVQYWDRASYLIQPIYPARSLFNLTGVIISKFSWDGIVTKMFQDSPSVVRGLTVVLTAEGNAYSYDVRSPDDIQYLGEGDRHDPCRHTHAVSVLLSGDLVTGVSNKTYTLTVYPSEEYFGIYTTNNPMNVAIGAICIVVFMTIIFFFYDTVVQKEFSAKQELFKAKRQFMRFVSHEVRTPLNAVCMGLTLLSEDVAKGIATYKAHLEKIHEQEHDGGCHCNHSNQTRDNTQATPLFSLANQPDNLNETPEQAPTTSEQETFAKAPPALFSLPAEAPSPLFSLPAEAKSNNADSSKCNVPPTSLFSFKSTAMKGMSSDEEDSREGKLNKAIAAPLPSPLTTTRNSTTRPCKCRCSAVLDRNKPTDECLEEWQDLLDDIYSSAQGSVDVLNDLLNYDKIESNTLSLELTAFSIWKLLQEVSGEFQLSAKQKGINFDIDFSDTVQEHILAIVDPESPEDALYRMHRKEVVIGDRIRIAQVLRNLISNGIKFTPEGGDILVRADWIQPREKGKQRRKLHRHYLKSGEEVGFEKYGTVEITVTDSGAGLSPEQVSRMFREGIQFNVNELQAGKGSGLGLFISKGIVKQHRGALSVSSKGLGCGTTFTLQLPLFREPFMPDRCALSHEILAPVHHGMEETRLTVGETTQTEDVQERTHTCLRVLVVDDIKTNRKLLARLLQNHGHITDEAADGREAVDKVMESMKSGHGTSAGYDAILMDYEMPVLKGPEAALEIRALGCDTFLVGITGNVLSDDVNYFHACGANAVLPKPVDVHKLEGLWVENGILANTKQTLHFASIFGTGSIGDGSKESQCSFKEMRSEG